MMPYGLTPAHQRTPTTPTTTRDYPPPPPGNAAGHPHASADAGGLHSYADGTPHCITVTVNREPVVSLLVSITNVNANSVVNSDALCTPVVATQASSNKRAASKLLMNVKNSPSPKKIFPQFSRLHGDDNSILSGDDPNGWEKEEETMIPISADLNEEEEKLANSLVDHVEAVHEWTLHTKEGNPDPKGVSETKPIEYKVV